MILIKDGTIKRVSTWEDNSIYILADFDGTITNNNSETSWNILSRSSAMPNEYRIESQRLFNHYRPIELDESLDNETKNKLMIEWWNKSIGLFVNYQLPERVIINATDDLKLMSFRRGAKEFLEAMKKRNIPIIIISAGLGNFIEQFLIKNNCYFDNIYIVSNFLKFENGIATGISNNVIHCLNKNEAANSPETKRLIANRSNIILFGDSITDIKMASDDKKEDALKIGFLEKKVDEYRPYFEEQYDIICTEDTGYDEISQKLRLLR